MGKKVLEEHAASIFRVITGKVTISTITTVKTSKHIQFEVFIATKCDEVSSGDEPHEDAISIQHSADCLCLHQTSTTDDGD
jgi:hypothetical protein